MVFSWGLLIAVAFLVFMVIWAYQNARNTTWKWMPFICVALLALLTVVGVSTSALTVR